MTFDSRLFSGLAIIGCIGGIFYLGAIDAMILSAVIYGHATLTFDWLEPIEGALIVPFSIVITLAVLLRELRSLVRK